MMESLYVTYEKGRDNDRNNFALVMKTNLTGAPAATIKKTGVEASELIHLLLGHGKHKIMEIVDTFSDYNYDGVVFDIRKLNDTARVHLYTKLKNDRINHVIPRLSVNTEYFYIENEDLEASYPVDQLYDPENVECPDGDYILVKLFYDEKKDEFYFCKSDGTQFTANAMGDYPNES